MRHKKIRPLLIVGIVLSGLVGIGIAAARQDKYTLKVPGGLAFSEFRGYESWQVVSISQDGDHIAVILANPVMIKAYEEGIPGNGKPFPDGSKMAKIHWTPQETGDVPRSNGAGRPA